MLPLPLAKDRAASASAGRSHASAFREASDERREVSIASAPIPTIGFIMAMTARYRGQPLAVVERAISEELLGRFDGKSLRRLGYVPSPRAACRTRPRSSRSFWRRLNSSARGRTGPSLTGFEARSSQNSRVGLHLTVRRTRVLLHDRRQGGHARDRRDSLRRGSLRSPPLRKHRRSPQAKGDF